MEDAQLLLDRVLEFAAGREGIDAVVQTGSRARGERVDAFADLDIELIGPGASRLVGRDHWPTEIAPVLVSVHLANDAPGAPDWPTCLVVFAQGRKIDFTLAGRERLQRLADHGLDATYRRGYIVHFDRTGLTAHLPMSRPAPPRWRPPAADEFIAAQREFWFEATQVPIYAARGELWPANARLAETRKQLLRMLEWRAGAVSGGLVDTWYLGYHLDDWVDPGTRAVIRGLFARYDNDEILRSLRAAISLYAEAVAATGEALSLPVLALRDQVEQHLAAVLEHHL